MLGDRRKDNQEEEIDKLDTETEEEDEFPF